MKNSIVRNNLMTRRGYTPYCGGSMRECRSMPRTKFDGTQFVCPACGWRSDFPAKFITEYKKNMGLDTSDLSTVSEEGKK